MVTYLQVRFWPQYWWWASINHKCDIKLLAQPTTCPTRNKLWNDVGILMKWHRCPTKKYWYNITGRKLRSNRLSWLEDIRWNSSMRNEIWQVTQSHWCITAHQHFVRRNNNQRVSKSLRHVLHIICCFVSKFLQIQLGQRTWPQSIRCLLGISWCEPPDTWLNHQALLHLVSKLFKQLVTLWKGLLLAHVMLS